MRHHHLVRLKKTSHLGHLLTAPQSSWKKEQISRSFRPYLTNLQLSPIYVYSPKKLVHPAHHGETASKMAHASTSRGKISTFNGSQIGESSSRVCLVRNDAKATAGRHLAPTRHKDDIPKLVCLRDDASSAKFLSPRVEPVASVPSRRNVCTHTRNDSHTCGHAQKIK